MSFDINQEVTVYIARDVRPSSKPAWMQSFADSGSSIVIAGMAHSLYRNTFPQGTIELGGNEGVSNSSMYSVMVTNGELVMVVFPTFPGMDGASKDIDGDGKAEDINGNGRLVFADLVALFEHLDSAVVQDNPQFFDFNGNGVVDMADVLELFSILTVQGAG